MSYFDGEGEDQAAATPVTEPEVATESAESGEATGEEKAAE